MDNVLFRFEANETLGMGHAYRCVNIINTIRRKHGVNCIAAISDRSLISVELLRENDIYFIVVKNDEDLIISIVDNSITVVVNDLLNTDREYIKKLKSLGCRVVNFEDEGSGSMESDVVINELYENSNYLGHYYGKDYYCLPQNMLCQNRREFSDTISTIGLLFGNTDPSHLTEKCLVALSQSDLLEQYHLLVVAGKTNSHKNEIEELISLNRYENSIEMIQGGDLSNILNKIDVAVSSQGRTIFELAHYRIPSIILAQNERETLHTFASINNGFINLGLGCLVSERIIINALELICESQSFRHELYSSMNKIHLENGIDRVINLILCNQEVY